MSVNKESIFLFFLLLQLIAGDARVTRPWKSCTKKFQSCYSSSWAVPKSMSTPKSMPCCNRYDTCIVKNYHEAECIPEGMMERMRDDPEWDTTPLDLEEMPDTVLGGPKCELARKCNWCEGCSGKDACQVSTFDGKPILPEAVVEDDPEGFVHITGFYDSDYEEDDWQDSDGPGAYAYVSMAACVDLCRKDDECNLIHWWNQHECSGELCFGRCNRYSPTKKWCPAMACPTVSNEGSEDHTFIKKSACPDAYPPMPHSTPAPEPAPGHGSPDTPGSYY